MSKDIDMSTKLAINQSNSKNVVVRQFTNDDLNQVQQIFTSYHQWLQLDLSFQDYENEFKNLPGKYDPKQGGIALLAFMKKEGVEQQADGDDNDEVELIGFLALRKLELTNKVRESLQFKFPHQYLSSMNCCELKRLFVMPQARGLQIGKLLISRILQEAKRLQYDFALLDTLPDRMQNAVRLYQNFGFQETSAYYDLPSAIQPSFFVKEL